MTKKLIALDLDGTLLRPDGTISEFTKTTIKDVQKLDILEAEYE